MKKIGTGIYRKANGKILVRASARQPDGSRRDCQKTLPASTSLEDATAAREDLRQKMRPARQYQTSGHRLETVGDYIALWYERKAAALKPSTATKYHDYLDRFILDHFEGVDIEELSRHHVTEWVSWADRQRQSDSVGYSVETRRGWWNVLKMVLLDLHAELGLERNPIARVKPPKVDDGRKRSRSALTRDELARFVDACETMIPPRFAEVYTLATTGMRVGEAHGLFWECVDWERDELELRRSATKGVLTETTKTGYARTVPMCHRLAELLREHRKDAMAGDGIASRLVFPSNNGKPRYSGSLRKSMNSVAEAIGLGVRVGPQTLRRTFNTLCIQAGVSEVVLRSQVGHRSPEMTHLYSSVETEAKAKSARRALGDIFR